MSPPPAGRTTRISALDLLNASFPFHLQLDHELVITGFGRSLPRVCPGIATGDPLTEHLAPADARGRLDAQELGGGEGMVVLRSVRSQLILRCQVLAGPAPAGDPAGAGEILLLAAPWLPGLEELTRAGLTVGDFAPHDPSPDYLFLAQAQLTALEDARRLARRLAEMEAQRRHQALHDHLTGAANRRCFSERMAEIDSETSLVLIDVDHFKDINDTFGHEIGDSVLCAVVERLNGLAPPGSVARLGGDEFAVLLTGPGAEQAGVAVARGIVAAMGEPVQCAGRKVLVSVSVGAASTGDADTLNRNADVALYSAKEQGRGRAVVFDAALHEALHHRLQLRDRLGTALADHTIDIAYQPILTLDTGRVHGFEALARWTDPELGPVPPAVFIGVAEEAGLIAELGMFVLRQGAHQLAAWRSRYAEANLSLSVNLAPRQLEDLNLTDDVRSVLLTEGLPAHSLQLELTESAFTGERRNLDQLHRLRDLGVLLAIDDFGSSESTLVRLHTVPATTLKTDRAFLDDARSEPDRTLRLMHAVVSIARALDLTTVAEGIETAEHVAMALEAGCQLGQGYYFARPMDARSADDFLRRRLEAGGQGLSGQGLSGQGLSGQRGTRRRNRGSWE